MGTLRGMYVRKNFGRDLVFWIWVSDLFPIP